MGKNKVTKVYHIEVFKNITTTFDENHEFQNKSSSDVIKCVGDGEMSAFIGENKSRDKNGKIIITPKVGYYKQLGYKAARCVKVADKKGNSLPTESEDKQKINLLINPPKKKSATETLTERLDRLEAENKRLTAQVEDGKNESVESIKSVPVDPIPVEAVPVEEKGTRTRTKK